MPMSPRLLRPRASGDPDAGRYIAAVQTADGQALEPAVRQAIEAFVRGCKSDGIWSAIKASCILMGARTLSGALTPLVGNAITNNGPFVSSDYNRRTGLIGNGTSKYLTTTNPVTPQQNNAHHSCYITDNTVSPSGTLVTHTAVWPTSGTDGRTQISSDSARTFTRCRENTGNTVLSTSTGFVGISRSASADYTLRRVSSNTTVTAASTGVPNQNLFVFVNPAIAQHSDARLAFVSFGESLSLSALDSRVSALNNAIWSATADSDARAYVASVEAADGQSLEPAVREAINAFITGCKADGIWPAIKASCILMGARTLSGALTPLVGTAPTNNNFVSGDYNRKTGLLGDGTTKFLNSNRANNVSGQNDRHSSVYVTTLPASGQLVIGAGSNGTGSTNMGRGGADGNALFARSVPLSSTLGGDPAANNSYNHSVAVNTGFWGLRRASGTEFSLRAQGVTDLVTATGAAVSGTPSSDNLFIFGRNTGSGAANGIAAARLAWYSLGDSLDLSLLDGRVTTLYNAIGAAIP